MAIVAAILLLALVGLGFYAILAPKYGLFAPAAAIVLVGLAVPRELITVVADTSGDFSTIATPGIAIMTFTVTVSVAAVAILLGRGRLRIPVIFGLFIVVLFVKMLVVWDGSVMMWSGFFLYVTGIVAWIIGAGVGREIYTRVTPAQFVVTAVLLVLVLELVVSIVQVAGVQLPAWMTGTERSLEESLGRASGTVGHPANLAKLVFLLTVLVLPFTFSVDSRIRRLAWTAAGIGVVIAGLTISRANIAAQVTLLALWVLTYPGSAKIGTRVLGAIGIAAAAAVFAPAAFERFAVDEQGGLRPQLLEAALEQLQRNFIDGTGPNSYIQVVSAYDRATAAGYPVHNGFLLPLAELGLFPAIMFFVPFVAVLIAAMRSLSRAKRIMLLPRVVAYSLPGFAFILTTGWGLVSGFNLIGFLFVFGALSFMGTGQDSGEHAIGGQLPREAMREQVTPS